MADKRMFSKSIIESDVFIELPIKSQLLYIHLNMNADDDGMINRPLAIAKTIDCSKKELDTLIAKRFVIAFDSGIIAIKHWRINNYIRKDTYKPTNYQDEFKQLAIKDNGSYTLACNVKQQSPPPNASESSANKNNTHSAEKFEKFWEAYPKKQGKSNARKAFEKLSPNDELFKKILDSIQDAKKSRQWQADNGIYIPNASKWITEERWEDELPKASKDNGSRPKFFTDQDGIKYKLVNGEYEKVR